MSREWWVRVKNYDTKSESRPANSLSILVPVQSWHIARVGAESQMELKGLGTLDLHMQIPDSGRITKQEAHSYVRSELVSFKKAGREDPLKSRRDLMERSVETLEGACFGVICRAPNGSLSQEVLVCGAEWSSHMQNANVDVGSYHLLAHLGSSCVDANNLHCQPAKFRDWVSALLCGKTVAPKGRAPKWWGNFARDSLVFSIISNLADKGIHPTQNEATQGQVSGCAIVAHEAKAVRLRGIASYETVKKIYLDQKGQRRG